MGQEKCQWVGFGGGFYLECYWAALLKFELVHYIAFARKLSWYPFFNITPMLRRPSTLRVKDWG